MDKRLELSIAQNFQVVPDMNVEGSRDCRDRCPGVVFMVPDFKPCGALQKDGYETVIGMRSQSDLVTAE